MWCSAKNVVQAVRLRRDSIVVAFTRLLPFVLLNAIAAFWALTSPSDIFAAYPRLFFWTLGFLNSKLVVRRATESCPSNGLS